MSLPRLYQQSACQFLSCFIKALSGAKQTGRGSFCRSLLGIGRESPILPGDLIRGFLLMPSVYILIPDAALREAVTEQLSIEALGQAQEQGAVPASPPIEPAVVILDEAADAKTIKKLRAIKNEHCAVLLLGNPPEGCDETLVTEAFAKPVRLGHLLGRLRFHLEVAPKLRSKPMEIGPYRLEAQQRSLTQGSETVRLTEKETALLEYLAQSTAPVGRDELLASVWGYDARIDTHTLETHIYQLRRKLGAELILNEGGLYRLAT